MDKHTMHHALWTKLLNLPQRPPRAPGRLAKAAPSGIWDRESSGQRWTNSTRLMCPARTFKAFKTPHAQYALHGL